MISTLIQNAASEEVLDDALRQAFAVQELDSATLQSRLDATMSETRKAQAKRQARGRMARRGLALSGALGILALAAVALPKILVRRVLAQMEAAAENVRSMHSVQYSIENGARRKIRETWFQNGRWRIETPRNVQIFSGGKIYSYEPRAHLVLSQVISGKFAFNASGFTIRALMADMARRKWSDKITIAPDLQVLEGRRARVATIEPAHENIRIVLYADPDTMLPFRSEILRPTSHGWQIQEWSTVEYNRTLQADLFEPKFPPGTRVEQEGAGRDEWARSLRKPLATLNYKQQRIAVRDIQTNERGDVFVLYTAGRERLQSLMPNEKKQWSVPQVPLRLWDVGREPSSEGWLPVNPSENPHIGKMDGSIEALRVDGEPLQWQVWTRAETRAAKGPHPTRFLLSVQEKYAEVKNANGTTSYFFDRTARGPAATFDIPRVTCAVLPAYERFFPMRSATSDADLLNASDEARANDLRDTQGASQQQLERALALYKSIIKRAESAWRATGNSGVQPDKWLAIADVSLKLGRRDEASQALARAEEDDRVYGNSTRDIEALRAKMPRE